MAFGDAMFAWWKGHKLPLRQDGCLWPACGQTICCICHNLLLISHVVHLVQTYAVPNVSIDHAGFVRVKSGPWLQAAASTKAPPSQFQHQPG